MVEAEGVPGTAFWTKLGEGTHGFDRAS